MADLSDIVRISSTIEAGGVARQDFGTGLLITTDDALAAGGASKVRRLASDKEARDLFSAGSTARSACEAWFKQDPLPRNLYVGRWAHVDVDTVLTGGTAIGGVNQLKVNNASFRFDGNDVTVDLSGDTNYTELADGIETAIQALTGHSGTTFVYDTDHFVLTLADSAAIEGGALAPHSAGTGADISALLDMDAGSATYAQGHDAETIGDALDELESLVTGGFYYVMLDTGVPAEVGGANTAIGLANRANASKYMASIQVVGDSALVANEAASEGARLYALGLPRTILTHSKTTSHKHVSIAARLSGMNLQQAGSLITPMFKSLPGETPDTYTTGERAELTRKRTNRYVRRGGVAMFEEGWTPQAGTWADVRIWLDWLVNELEADVFNLLRSTPRLALTSAGVGALRDTITATLEKGVSNGGIAPGKVSPAFRAAIIQATRNYDFDGYLSNGYLLNIGSLAAMSQTDRDSRVSPPIKVWLKGSPAIHSVDIDLNFEN